MRQLRSAHAATEAAAQHRRLPKMSAAPAQEELLGLLACPVCGRAPLDLDGARVACEGCVWEGLLRGKILSVPEEVIPASFDEKHDMVEDHNHHSVVWELCYRRQCEAIEAAVAPGGVLLDLGCGPSAPYEKPPGTRIIGVDPSLRSLLSNHEIDVGLHTTAVRLPLADDSVDAIVAVYALHHMIGDTVDESGRNVEAAMAEMGRVAKPGAQVLVMEICPWAPAWAAERAGWRLARRLLRSRVDFVFWPVAALAALGATTFAGARLQVQRFNVGRLKVFPPVIGAPWLKVPRFAYPFDVVLLHWTLSTEQESPAVAPNGTPWWSRPAR